MATKLFQKIKNLYPYLFENEVGIFPLISFRIAFGILMLISLLRFWYNGWIESLYLSPTFFFKYYGFYWVPEPSSFAIYTIFILMLIACINISIGFLYRFSIVVFFLLFTYTELIDASNYLNHYYFISIITFLLIFLPANKYFALDNLIFRNQRTTIKAWQINIIKFQLVLVYCYAGIAKINSDWIWNAIPLKIWLPAKVHLLLIGPLLTYKATAYLFSWGGLLFDLFIVFFLMYRKTRVTAYIILIVFHILTWLLFPIGMFPFVMIASTLIFFSENAHKKFYQNILKAKETATTFTSKKLTPRVKYSLFIFISFQLLFPFRYLYYNDKLFWTEQGYRFSWRVMLIEKAGYASFTIKDELGNQEVVDNHLYLSVFQEKMMSTQADFILQYAHFLKEEYEKKGKSNIEVYADVYVSLNGKPSSRFINNTIDLTQFKDSFKEKTFILPRP